MTKLVKLRPPELGTHGSTLKWDLFTCFFYYPNEGRKMIACFEGLIPGERQTFRNEAIKWKLSLRFKKGGSFEMQFRSAIQVRTQLRADDSLCLCNFSQCSPTPWAGPADLYLGCCLQVTDVLLRGLPQALRESAGCVKNNRYRKLWAIYKYIRSF